MENHIDRTINYLITVERIDIAGLSRTLQTVGYVIWDMDGVSDRLLIR